MISVKIGLRKLNNYSFPVNGVVVEELLKFRQHMRMSLVLRVRQNFLGMGIPYISVLHHNINKIQLFYGRQRPESNTQNP